MINRYLLVGIEEVSKREFMRITLTSDDCKEILKLIDKLNDLQNRISELEDKLNLESKGEYENNRFVKYDSK